MGTAIDTEAIQPTSKLNRVAKRWDRRSGARQYTDEEIGTALAVLDHYDGNALRTARELCIPRNTICRWVEAYGQGRLSPACVSVRQRKREEFAQLSDEAAEWIVTSITKADVRRAGLRDKVVAYGILRDKSAQDRGEATSIVEHRGETARQALERLYELARAQRPDITKAEVRATLVARRPELASVLPDE